MSICLKLTFTFLSIACLFLLAATLEQAEMSLTSLVEGAAMADLLERKASIQLSFPLGRFSDIMPVRCA